MPPSKDNGNNYMYSAWCVFISKEGENVIKSDVSYNDEW